MSICIVSDEVTQPHTSRLSLGFLRKLYLGTLENRRNNLNSKCSRQAKEHDRLSYLFKINDKADIIKTRSNIP